MINDRRRRVSVATTHSAKESDNICARVQVRHLMKITLNSQAVSLIKPISTMSQARFQVPRATTIGASVNRTGHNRVKGGIDRPGARQCTSCVQGLSLTFPNLAYHHDLPLFEVLLNWRSSPRRGLSRSCDTLHLQLSLAPARQFYNKET